MRALKEAFDVLQREFVAYRSSLSGWRARRRRRRGGRQRSPALLTPCVSVTQPLTTLLAAPTDGLKARRRRRRPSVRARTLRAPGKFRCHFEERSCTPHTGTRQPHGWGTSYSSTTK